MGTLGGNEWGEDQPRLPLVRCHVSSPRPGCTLTQVPAVSAGRTGGRGKGEEAEVATTGRHNAQSSRQSYGVREVVWDACIILYLSKEVVRFWKLRADPSRPVD